MALLKTFYCDKGPNRPIETLSRSDAVSFSIGFRWLVSRLKGRLKGRSVALPPLYVELPEYMSL